MLPNARRTILALFGLIVTMAACGRSEEAADPVVAAAAPAPELLPIEQEIVSVNADVTLPGVWKYGYQLVDRADTTLGAFRSIEFHYVGDSARKVPSRLLLVIRVFKQATWDKVGARQPPVATRLVERGDDVFAYSIVTSNPYPANTASALRVDAMMLALIADSSPFKLTFR